MTTDESLELILQIIVEDGDDEEIDKVSRRLYRELIDLDVDSVERISMGIVPEGAKSVDPTLLGLLIVSVGPIMLTKFLEFLHAWCMRDESRTVKIKMQAKSGDAIEIEVPTQMSPSELKGWINIVHEKLSTFKK